jgi:hypothetical protein
MIYIQCTTIYGKYTLNSNIGFPMLATETSLAILQNYST